MIEPIHRKRHPHRALIKKILENKILNVEIIKNREFRYEVENEDGKIVYSRAHRVQVVDGKELDALIEESKHRYKLFLNIPNNHGPYWLKAMTLYDPNNFQPVNRMVPYLEVCKVALTGDMIRFEERKHEKAMEEFKKQCELEELFIDDTDYEAIRKKYRQLLISKNNNYVRKT